MLLRPRNVLLMQSRWKGKKHWALQRKKTNADRALENFDDFYGSVYGLRWRNMRAAMLTEHKYMALVNNFGDTEKTCSMLEMDGAINVKSIVQLAKERLEEEEPIFSKETSYKLDSKIHELIKRQESREIKSIYPEINNNMEPVELPEHLPEFRNDNAEAKTPAESRTTNAKEEQESHTPKYDMKKSLEQAIEEDTCIDYQRMVIPEQGSGGLYQYIPANKIKGMEDWIPESEHYKYYQTTTDFPLKYEMETEFNFPENLCLYTYEMGNCEDFKPPRKSLTGVLSHFLMDGASILPPLFLDVRHGERVLDACAAPGGKSLLMLQTLYPELLVCNDIQESRVNRIHRLLKEYLFDLDERWLGKRLMITQSDARNITEYDAYDKILVDVPCTTDRHSLMENDNNIFKPTRVKERLRLPELQAGILMNCLRLLKPGGTLVYSTCSLSPVQNDGVVHMALQKAFTEYNLTATVKDLSILVSLFKDIYRFEQSKGLKYGQMVVPYLPANFGPMYFSKIRRDT